MQAMAGPDDSRDELAQRRRRAVRTAAIAGGIALAIYLAFILSGVVGR